VTGGEDALGETSVVVELDGQTAPARACLRHPRGGGRAYVRALSNAVRRAERATRPVEPAAAP